MVDLASHSLDDGCEGLLHVPRLLPFIVCPFKVKPQYRDAPFIHNVWVNLTVAMMVGNHFSASGKSHESTVIFASTLFQFFSIAVPGGRPMEGPHLWHPITASDLNMVAARKP